MKIFYRYFWLFIFIFAVGFAAQAFEQKLQTATIFKGEKKFAQIVAKSQRENWRVLPMGERVARFGRELLGVPYKSFSLEIDDHIEQPSADFGGLDCWTYFEICLALARMIDTPKPQYSYRDLLAEIENNRYRGGVCTGNYLERIHYLAEWFYDNERRGNIQNITRQLGGMRHPAKQPSEMSNMVQEYRYLRENPELRAPMAVLEKKLTHLPVFYIPKNKVASIEKFLQNGDIIGITTHKDGGYCSHVGIIIRDDKGRARLAHASTTYKKVVQDKSISQYLAKFRNHSGIIVARPLTKRF